MEIKELFSTENNDQWIKQIGKSGWSAGQFLYQLLSENRLKELCGETTRVFMLTDGDNLAAFCTLAELDDVRDTELGPWIGFVYTFPQYRGHRYMGILLDAAYDAAKKDGAKEIYISTRENGLYEKYGYSFYQMMKDMHGEDSRVYRLRRNDLVSINHRVAAFMESYFDVIFAVNELTHPGEKRLMQICRKSCKILPVRFEENLNRLFGALFIQKEDAVGKDLGNIIERLQEIL